MIKNIIIKLIIIISIWSVFFVVAGKSLGHPLALSLGLLIGAVNCALIMGIGAKMLAKPEVPANSSTAKKAAAIAGVMALKVFAPAAAVFVVLIPFNMPPVPVIVGLLLGFASFIAAMLWERKRPGRL